MSSVAAMKAINAATPDYPGREALQALLRPVVEPLARKYAGHHVQRLLGFWFCWQVMGGMDGMVGSGMWSRAAVYRQRHEFHEVFGMEVEVWAPHLALAIIEADKADRAAMAKQPAAS